MGFSPKPTPGPNFIKIGVGVRTLVLHSLLDGLLSGLYCIFFIITRGCEVVSEIIVLPHDVRSSLTLVRHFGSAFGPEECQEGGSG